MNFLKGSLAVVIICLISLSCDDSSTVPETVNEEITIGALIPFSGNFGQQGEAFLKALEFAVIDANEELASVNKRIKLIYDNTGTDEDLVKKLAESYISQNIRIIIGPITSLELSAVKDTINNSETLIISPSSTAVSLSIENDNIFRLVPDDSKGAEAIVNRMKTEGIEKLAIIHQSTEWGNALASSINSSFQDNSGTLINQIDYFSFRNTEYRECLSGTSESVKNELITTDANKIAVQITAYDEGVQFLELAKIDNYEGLDKVSWYGSDGITLSHYLLENENAVEFARKVNFVSPIFELEENDKYTQLRSRLVNELGYEPSAFIYLAYDALRSAATTLAQVKEDISVKTLSSKLTEVLNGYEGVSGTVLLNNAGDRDNGNFTFWGLNKSGEPQWEVK